MNKTSQIGDWIGIAVILFILFFFLLIPVPAKADWGKTGHRVVGQIAQDNLTPAALKAVTEILKGETLATASTWSDEIKSDSSYDEFKKWHYVNLPLDKKYSEVEHQSENIVTAINRCIKVLQDNKSTKEDKTFHLKFLVHLVGDIHQPLHVGRYEDLGGNKIYVKFFGENSNIHRVWDSDMINNYKMSYTELSDYLQSYKEIDFVQGDAVCWANESQDHVKEIYSNIEEQEKLSYNYLFNNFYTVKDRLFRAGIRLANILNKIYE